MYIMNEAGTEIMNADFVERFCVVKKPDTVLIVASYGADRCVTVGRYGNLNEAAEAMVDLSSALARGQAFFDMPNSLLFAEQTIKKDARTKRRGGS